MSVLGGLFGGADRIKRKLGGLLQNPLETVALGSTRMAEDMNALSALASEAGYMPRTVNRANQSVLVSPQQKAIARALLADKGTDLGSNMIGATVWHGSPHRFDKFDSSKIGTGEGAQAYGHGLYLAETPEVATTYSNLRAAPNMEFHTASGRKLTGLEKSIADDMLSNGMASARIGAKANGPEWMDAFNRIKDENITRGNLYKVDLPDNAIARMLDWDKKLSAQPEAAKYFKEMHEFNGGKGYVNSDGGYTALGVGSTDALTGKDLVDYLTKIGGGRADTSGMLRQQGIPGIRYLDGGSRGAGQGSSNYVVFPGQEDLLQILERNGVPIK